MLLRVNVLSSPDPLFPTYYICTNSPSADSIGHIDVCKSAIIWCVLTLRLMSDLCSHPFLCFTDSHRAACIARAHPLFAACKFSSSAWNCAAQVTVLRQAMPPRLIVSLIIVAEVCSSDKSSCGQYCRSTQHRVYVYLIYCLCSHKRRRVYWVCCAHSRATAHSNRTLSVRLILSRTTVVRPSYTPFQDVKKLILIFCFNTL